MLALVSPEAQELLPAAIAEADALLAPAAPDLIVVALTPILAQVAGASLDTHDREEWLIAAADALRGIPGDLLYRGIRVARVSVDHPAKVVPAIMGAVQQTWATRRADRSSLGWLSAALERPREQPVDVCTPDEAAEILREVGGRSAVAPQEARAPAADPTIDDYLALGLTQEEAEAAMDERRRLLSRGARGFGAAAEKAVGGVAAGQRMVA